MAESNYSLLAQFEAKPGMEEEVAEFLEDALARAEQEPETTTWFALRFDESRFGIFDTFADEEGRQAHLEGEIAADLLANADDWFVDGPDIQEVEVLAAMHSE